MDLTFKKVGLQYHPQGENLPLTAETNPTQSKNTINWKSPTEDYMNIIWLRCGMLTTHCNLSFTMCPCVLPVLSTLA